jgi:hypothetical protein
LFLTMLRFFTQSSLISTYWINDWM